MTQPIDTGPVTCDQCTEPAVFSYSWDWGQTGVCCAKHQFVLNQKARHLKRHVAFTRLGPVQPAPVTRDERTRLIAAKLSAEAETGDVKLRALDLSQANEKLAQEVRRLTLLNGEQASQLKDARVTVDQLAKDRDAALHKLAESADELLRVRQLLDAATAPKRPVAPAGKSE